MIMENIKKYEKIYNSQPLWWRIRNILRWRFGHLRSFLFGVPGPDLFFLREDKKKLNALQNHKYYAHAQHPGMQLAWVRSVYNIYGETTEITHEFEVKNYPYCKEPHVWLKDINGLPKCWGGAIHLWADEELTILLRNSNEMYQNLLMEDIEGLAANTLKYLQEREPSTYSHQNSPLIN